MVMKSAYSCTVPESWSKPGYWSCPLPPSGATAVLAPSSVYRNHWTVCRCGAEPCPVRKRCKPEALFQLIERAPVIPNGGKVVESTGNSCVSSRRISHRIASLYECVEAVPMGLIESSYITVVGLTLWCVLTLFRGAQPTSAAFDGCKGLLSVRGTA